MANQYNIDPAILQELQAWKAYRDSVDPNTLVNDPVGAAKYNGDNLSAGAKQYAVGRYDPATGKPANGLNGQHFDVKTGQIENNKGFFQLPESYAILGAAAGLGGLAAAPLLAGGAGGGAAATAAPAATAGTGVGAGTAATVGGAAAVAPKAAGGIASWLTSPTASLIEAGVGAAGNIVGGIQQANASKEAQAFQEKQFEEALQAQKEQGQYDRNQYAAYLGRLQGYSDTGNAASGRLAAFMGQGRMPTNVEGPALHPSATAPPPMPASTPGGAPAAPFQPPPQGAPLPGGGQQAQTVKMVGPDGSIRNIAQADVPKYTALGAKLAQAGA